MVAGMSKEQIEQVIIAEVEAADDGPLMVETIGMIAARLCEAPTLPLVELAQQSLPPVPSTEACVLFVGVYRYWSWRRDRHGRALVVVGDRPHEATFNYCPFCGKPIGGHIQQ